MNYTLEQHVNDRVKTVFKELGLKSQEDWHQESEMSGKLKDALSGSSKTDKKTGFGRPDFSIEKYSVPVIIENKLGLKRLESVFNTDAAIKSYATNGAIYYANQVIKANAYPEVFAIGIAGDSEDDFEVKIYYVYGENPKDAKCIASGGTEMLNFLQNEASFVSFLNESRLTEEDRHRILIETKEDLGKRAKILNRLMHNLNISAANRVLFVSGFLLSMQTVTDTEGNKIADGLTPEALTSLQSSSNTDGRKIVRQIKDFLTARGIPASKVTLMMHSFKKIQENPDNDTKQPIQKEVAKLISQKASNNKQLFTFIYENIFRLIGQNNGPLDIMGELYSEFLKYALGDGKEIGIVLTPPYVTDMMTEILDTDMNSRVMDLATGSAGFLIAAMDRMTNDAKAKLSPETDAYKEKEVEIKKNQLLGVELNTEMFTLAATNMILRGDGSSNIQKGSSFDQPAELWTEFKANRLLLNPPFSYAQNGMPFIEFGLDHMERGGKAAIIIQDSAGTGKAIKSNKHILKRHTLVASIKMPTDLFMPMAGVQTSIYVFEAGTPHDYDKTVRFIDFRNDGFKRTKRSLQEIDSPVKRYRDIIKIYKAGSNARGLQAEWNLDECVVDDQITDSGADWDFNQHKVIDTTPTLEDFMTTVGDYLAWEVDQLIKGDLA